MYKTKREMTITDQYSPSQFSNRFSPDDVITNHLKVITEGQSTYISMMYIMFLKLDFALESTKAQEKYAFKEIKVGKSSEHVVHLFEVKDGW